ncbi:MAG: SPFH domain-containing protein [Candidatus Limnocylindria bacterium]
MADRPFTRCYGSYHHDTNRVKPGELSVVKARRLRRSRSPPPGHRPESLWPWGIKVSIVEVKDVELPQEMKRAMARQAEAERDKRAKIINAEGEFLAAEQLANAANIINAAPSALQVRYLQTLSDISSDQSRTIIFPLPMDLISAFIGAGGGSDQPKVRPVTPASGKGSKGSAA